METTATTLEQFEQDSARYYNRNFIAGLVHGIFFQMASAFGNINTVLPAFVTLLTPSSIAVGLMATVQSVGTIIPQIFTAYLLEDRPRKKPYLLGAITIRWVSWGVLAWLTYRYGATNPMLVLAVLISLFGLFSLAGGVGTVVYADIFARAIPANRRGRFTGARQIGGFTLAILAGGIVKYILGNETAYPFPLNYTIIFMLSAITLAIAFTGFALIREPVYPVERNNTSLQSLWLQSKSLVAGNRNFQILLVSQFIMNLAVGMAPFFVVHARQAFVSNAGIVGIFLSAQMAGAALSNILWGWMADRFGNKSVIVGSLLSGAIATALALILPQLLPLAYSAVFVLVGTMLSGMRIGYSNFILEMAPTPIRANCVALKNTLLAPAALFPLVVGSVITVSSFEMVFGATLVLLLAGAWYSLRLTDPRHNKNGECA